MTNKLTNNLKMQKLRKSKPRLMSTLLSQLMGDLLGLNPRTIVSHERNRRAAGDERFLRHKTNGKLTFYSYEHGLEMLRFLMLERGKGVKINNLSKLLGE